MKIRSFLAGALALAASFLATPAEAGSSCQYITTGAVLTAAQWNSCFQAKQNELNYTPINRAGDGMQGLLTTPAATTSTAGFRVYPGVAPSAPTNGDMWSTSTGFYVRVNGSTVGPLRDGTSASFAATSPVTVSFPSSVVTYAFDFSVANTWTATQTMRTILAGTTNTFDVGTSATVAAFRTIYAGTSFVGPIGTFTTSVAVGGATIGANALAVTGASLFNSAITYGGVTLANSVTGTGSMVLSIGPTFTSSFTATGLVTNASLANMGAWSFKGNATAGSAVPTDVTIDGLTNKASPVNADELLLADSAASFGWKKCTIQNCIAAVTSGVASIAGNTGAFTLGAGLTNSTNNILMLFEPGSITNCTLTGTVSANALTIALKTQAGADPTSTTPCVVSFRSATIATGDYTAVLVTAATSFATATSGSTFGSTNATPFRLWITAWNNAGTVVLGVSNQSTATQIYPLNEAAVQSSTACNACSNATAAGTFYTTAAQTSKATRILGYMDWSSGLTTAGTWASGPTTIQMFGPGVKKPGDVVQRIYGGITTAVTNTNTYTISNTAPVPANGTIAFAFPAVTATSTANYLRVTSNLILSTNAGGAFAENYLYDGTNTVSTTATFLASSTVLQTLPNSYQVRAPSASTTYTVYFSGGSASIFLNSQAGSNQFGGTAASNGTIEEIMGALPEPANDNANPGIHARAA